MRHRITISLFALTFVLFFSGCDRSQEAVLAEVNNRAITSNEFLPRYQKYLQSTSERDNILVRKKILNNMINEALILQDAHRRGYDSDKRFEERLQDITAQALLDGYAKKMTSDAENVIESELWREFHKYNSKVSARFVYGKTKEEAWGLKKRLQDGESFDDVAKEVFEDPDLSKNGGYLGYFGWGELEPSLEETAYTLPVGVLSDPVRMKVGYGIVKVENKVGLSLASEYDFAKKKPELEKAVRQRKIVQRLTKAADSIEIELAPNFNQQAVETLFGHWAHIMERQPTVASIEGGVTGKDEKASEVFVEFKSEKWTTEQFLSKLEKTRKQHRDRVKTREDIKEIAVGLAVRSRLLQEAREIGLDLDREVQSQIQSVSEDYILRRWASSVEDTVGSSGWDAALLRKEFDANRELYAEPAQVNTSEILVRSGQVARSLHKLISGGEDFGELARAHSIRLWAAKRRGELGFVSVGTFGDIGAGISQAKVGEVVGPFYVKPYFALYKILGFKKPRERTFKEARDDVILSLLPSLKKKAFSAAIDVLRANAHITMHVEALGRVVTPK